MERFTIRKQGISKNKRCHPCLCCITKQLENCKIVDNKKDKMSLTPVNKVELCEHKNETELDEN